MRLEKILFLLKQKESHKLEFKEARRNVPSSLFEAAYSPDRIDHFIEDVIFTTTIPIPGYNTRK